MSCYKCGKELPAGEVECDPSCDDPSFIHEDEEGNQFFGLTFKLDKKKAIANPEKLVEAMYKFQAKVGLALAESGLMDFLIPRK